MREKTIALIPARSGSKGLPGKNTRLLMGKPLIQWTIEAALGSKLIDKVYVSTDCQNIADIAVQCGAFLPDNKLRPLDLAQDITPGIDVVRHVVALHNEPCRFILLQPTSPLRTTKHIDEAMQLYEAQQDIQASVVSVSQTKPLSWQGPIDINGYWRPSNAQDSIENRQQAVDTYLLNGAIYIAHSSQILTGDFLSGLVRPYVMSTEDAVDIDTLSDFCIAEAILKLKQEGRVIL